ncbi:membrane integrity-associated transporter subunit PqiC [bacterium]|nr:MAG: membrane integrity-associated transporter subunit PqiC [bacterium]
MKKNMFLYCTVILYLIVSLSLAGCLSVSNSPNSRFYALRTLDKSQVGQKLNFPADKIIGVGPVKIPEYLNRPQIVTEDKNRMLTFAQFDRWGESPDFAINRLINENLIIILPDANIVMYPWNLFIPVSYKVYIDAVQMESRLDKDLFFAAQWSIIDLKNKKMAVTKRSEFRQPIEPHSYSGLVEALSTVCASLSTEIARELVSLADQLEEK